MHFGLTKSLENGSGLVAANVV